jgi:hypothetical protein
LLKYLRMGVIELEHIKSGHAGLGQVAAASGPDSRADSGLSGWQRRQRRRR